MCIIDCLSTIVFILPLYLDDTKVIILILWRRTFQLEYWRTFQLVSTDKLVGDTCIWLKTGDNTIVFTETGGNNLSVTGKDVPRVLPKARSFSINLNFLTGPLPKWILFHPYFAEWGPEILLFNQQENGKNSAGAKVGFNNIDAIKFNFEYYYGKEKSVDATVNGVAYPWYYQR